MKQGLSNYTALPHSSAMWNHDKPPYPKCPCLLHKGGLLCGQNWQALSNQSNGDYCTPTALMTANAYIIMRSDRGQSPGATRVQDQIKSHLISVPGMNQILWCPCCPNLVSMSDSFFLLDCLTACSVLAEARQQLQTLYTSQEYVWRHRFGIPVDMRSIRMLSWSVSDVCWQFAIHLGRHVDYSTKPSLIAVPSRPRHREEASW